MIKIIGVGEWAVSNKQNETIKTFSLGSCVAVIAYCRVNRVAGMVHVALPESKRKAAKGQGPGYYADSGVPLMINEMCSRYGCKTRRLAITLFGGAEARKLGDTFKIGPRNVIAVQKALAILGLGSDASQTGGFCSRTVGIKVATGEIDVVSYDMII